MTTNKPEDVRIKLCVCYYGLLASRLHQKTYSGELMLMRNIFVTTVAATLLAASTGFAMAQATGTENNATSGSNAGAGPNSGPEVKGSAGSMSGDTKGSAGSMEMKDNTPTSAGTADEKAKNLRGHSETPSTGAK